MTDNNDFLAIYGHRANLLNNNVEYFARSKNGKMAQLWNKFFFYTVEHGKNTDGKRSNKMAALNDPNLVE